MQLTKEQIEMGTGDNAKWPYDPAVSLLPIFFQNVVKNSHLV